LIFWPLQDAQRLSHGWWGASFLKGLAPRLSREQLSKAVEIARLCEGGDPDGALAAVAVQEAKLGRPQAAVETFLQITEEESRCEVLLAVAPLLPPALLGRALTAAENIESEAWRARALTNLVPHLPEALLRRVADVAGKFESEGLDQELLRSLLAVRRSGLGWPESALVATEKEIEKEIEKVRRLGLPESHLIERGMALARLGPYLSAALLDRALTVAARFRGEGARVALEGLVPHLPASLLGRALELALALKDVVGVRAADALAMLADRWASVAVETLSELCQRALRRRAGSERRALLVDLRHLAPALAALGGRPALVEAGKAVLDVARWWP
jgi:hypothetical protein